MRDASLLIHRLAPLIVSLKKQTLFRNGAKALGLSKMD